MSGLPPTEPHVVMLVAESIDQGPASPGDGGVAGGEHW